MKVHEAMTKAPAACEPTTSLRVAAQLMDVHDCAAIPVAHDGTLVGIITDRDITCRAVAKASNAPDLPVSDYMTSPVIAVAPDDPLDTAAELMQENRIHHLPVITADGRIVGMLAQSDLGRRMTNREFGELTRRTSIRTSDRCTTSSQLVRGGGQAESLSYTRLP